MVFILDFNIKELSEQKNLHQVNSEILKNTNIVKVHDLHLLSEKEYV